METTRRSWSILVTGAVAPLLRGRNPASLKVLSSPGLSTQVINRPAWYSVQPPTTQPASSTTTTWRQLPSASSPALAASSSRRSSSPRLVRPRRGDRDSHEGFRTRPNTRLDLSRRAKVAGEVCPLPSSVACRRSSTRSRSQTGAGERSPSARYACLSSVKGSISDGCPTAVMSSTSRAATLGSGWTRPARCAEPVFCMMLRSLFRWWRSWNERDRSVTDR